MDPKFALDVVDWLEKQQLSPEDFAPSPKAAQHKVEERAPKARTGEKPAGKVPIKIYELVRRGGRTFERARTAWVIPEVAIRLNQRKVATDWVRTFGNYLPLYFIGGYVRDKFFKKVSKDIDIITLIPLSEVRPILKKLNIAYKDKSNAHARINFEVGGISVDVISIQPNELAENLRSRDFTINAIAQSVTGQFYDPTRGLDDVKNKMLRTPGNDPTATFTNDPLRILRGVRFLADLPIKPHPDLEEAVKKTAKGLADKKPRRIGFELKRILSAAKPWVGVKYLVDWEILPHISQPLVDSYGVRQGTNHKYNAGPQTIAALKKLKGQDPLTNLAILFSNSGHSVSDSKDINEKSSLVARKELERLGFSKKDSRRIETMIYNLKIINLESPTPDDYRKVALSLDADLERFYKFVDAYVSTTRLDPSLPEKLKSEISKYSKVNREKDGEELRETGGVEKFDESEELMKSLVLAEINSSLGLLVDEDTTVKEIDSMIDLVKVSNG